MGKVTGLSVEEGDEQLLREMVLEPADLDHPPPRYVPGFNRLGEFAIGFNPLITELLKGKVPRNTLIAEKRDIHSALGDAYAVTGGTNSCAPHQDICLSSGPGSGVRLEAIGPSFDEPLVLDREGAFTDASLKCEGDAPSANAD